MPPRRSHRLAAAVLACGAAVTAQVACSAPAGTTRLTAGGPSLTSFALFFIAERSGCTSEAGLRVEFTPYATGRDALDSMLAGALDLALVYETPVALRAADAPALRLLTTMHLSYTDASVVAHRDRGIRRAADLRGKRVAVPLQTSAEYFLRTLLAFSGVPPDAVTLVELDHPRRAPEVLAAGAVDAVAIWPPFVAKAREAVGDGAVEIGSEIYTSISLLTTRQEVKAAPIEALVRCMAAAERLVQVDPDRAFELLRAAYPDRGEAELRYDFQRQVFELGLTHLAAALLEQEAAWLGSASGQAGALDFRRLFAPGPLAAAVPESVTYLGPH
jgi:NitT/TauT family transport system substrate-binding protein